MLAYVGFFLYLCSVNDAKERNGNKNKGSNYMK